jgi:methyl-accepting chemotaxis protein
MRIVTAKARGTAQEVVQPLASSVKAQLLGESPVLMIVFASTQQPLEQLMPLLAKQFPQTLLSGTSTAGEFTQDGDEQGATVLWALSGDFQVRGRMGRGLKQNLELAVQQAVQEIEHPLSGYPERTALVFLDPLSGNAEEATMLASGLLGAGISLVGGAAGDDLKMRSTSVALGTEVASDAMVIIMLHSKQPVGVGVSHGHIPLSRPLTVTAAEGAIVQQIEGKPAWQVWTEETATRCQDLGINPHELSTSTAIFDYLNRFEAGLSLGKEYKVRVPLAKDQQGAIHFACGIPEGTVIRIMESIKDKQIESAREAARRSLSQLHGKKPAGALVFDCSCRKTILKDDFHLAVAAIAKELAGAPLAGFETYGEIAMDVGDMSGFHNTTTVVVTFPSDSEQLK